MSNRNPFTQDDVEQILRIVDRLSDVEVVLESGDLKLHVRKGAVGSAPAAPVARAVATAPVAQGPVAARPAASAARAEPTIAEGLVALRAPMLGTFYRAPSPAEPPFVEVGARVAAGDPVGLVEVMKLFNTVNAPVAGTVVEIPAANGALVEYDEVLFVIRPAA